MKFIFTNRLKVIIYIIQSVPVHISFHLFIVPGGHELSGGGGGGLGMEELWSEKYIL